MTTSPLSGRLAYVVFGCFASGYFMSYALRSVNAVIAPELVGAFALSHAQLGALSSAYFFSFALLQLPLGIWLDRFGSRRTHATLLAIAALGCVVFALAPGPTMLWVGRALIGVGVSGALMAALKAYRFWYPAGRQQQLAAWMLVAGTAGALSVTVPVQHALPLLGWRGVFWLAAALVAAAAVAILTQLPRDEEQAIARGAGGPVWAGYREVYADPYFWRLGLTSIVVQGAFVSMQSLWAGPWFTQVLGMTPDGAASALFAFNLVLLLGYLALGWLAPRLEGFGWSTLRVTGVATVLLLAVQVAIALTGGPRAWLLWPVLAIVATFFTLVQPHISMTFPPGLTGRAYTAFNLLTFVAVFLCQWLFGVCVDLFRGLGQPTPDAFRHAMLVWVGIQALPFILLVSWRVQPRNS